MQPQPCGMTDNGIRVDNPIIIRVSHSTGVRQGPPVKIGDGGFDPNDYEGADSPSPSTTASLLPPHVKVAHIAYHYEQQEQQCYTCDKTGHFSWDCLVCLKALKDKKGLNLKGALNMGGQKPPKQPKRATEGTPPGK